KGNVQGVGFRWWTRSRALELGLAGHAISTNVTRRVLHRVVDCHACGDRATWGVNVERNVTSWVLCRKQKNLRAQLVRNLVINLGAQEDDAFTKQAIINA